MMMMMMKKTPSMRAAVLLVVTMLCGAATAMGMTDQLANIVGRKAMLRQHGRKTLNHKDLKVAPLALQDADPYMGWPRSFYTFSGWVRVYFWMGGVLIEKNDVIYRADHKDVTDDLEAAAKFFLVSTEGKDATDVITIGDTFKLQYVDTEAEANGRKQYLRNYLCLNKDDELVICDDPSRDVTVFQIRVKHDGDCVNACIGTPIATVEQSGLRLVHNATREHCGGYVDKPAYCGSKVGSWKNYQLTFV